MLSRPTPLPQIEIIASKLDRIAQELTDYCVEAYEAAVEDDETLGLLYKEVDIKEEKDVFIAGFTSKVEKGGDDVDRVHIETLPAVLNSTQRVFASVNIADTRYPINSNAVASIASKILEMGNSGAKFSVVTNMPSNTPFYPASYHSAGKYAITLGMAGAGVITSVIKENNGGDYNTLERRIIEAQELMIRLSERVGTQVANEVGVNYLGLDLSHGSVFSQGEKNSIAAAIEAVNGRKIGSVGTVSDFG